MSIETLITQVSEKTAEADKTFDQVMAEKVSARLDEMKKTVMQGILGDKTSSKE